jgi:hypothetical protein
MAIAARWADDTHSGDGEPRMKPNIKNEDSVQRTEPLGSNSEIGRRLKQYYDELVTEEIPDRFADLLKQLEDRETGDVVRKGE